MSGIWLLFSRAGETATGGRIKAPRWTLTFSIRAPGALILPLRPRGFSSPGREKLGRQVHLRRSPVRQRHVRTFVVVERDVLRQSRKQIVSRRVRLEVDVFVLQGSPESFDEHVVQRAASAVHADRDPA